MKKFKSLKDPISVGDAATISIGSDRYSAHIGQKSQSQQTLVAVYEKGGDAKTFRWSKTRKAWVSGNYFLSVGHAEDYRDPSF